MTALLPLTVALALVTAPAAPASPASPLDGCRAAPWGGEGGKGFTYACATLAAEAVDLDPRDAPALAKDLEETMRGNLGEGSRVSTSRGKVGGKDAWLLYGSSADRQVHARTTLVVRPEGLRSLGCIATDAARCGSLLAFLDRQPWRAGPAPGAGSTRSLQLAGRAVTAPPGCTLEPAAPEDGEGGVVVCQDGAEAMWVALAAPGKLAPLVARFEADAESLVPGGARSQVPCRVAGVAGRCTKVTGPAAGAPPGSTGVVLWGDAVVGGRTTAAFCMHLVAAGAAPGGLPPGCAVALATP